jgi:hypothetical protein
MRITVQPRQLFYTVFYRNGTSIFSVLQVDDFRNLWLGQLISFVGDSLAYNTMTFAIIQMAKDADVSYGRLLSLLFVPRRCLPGARHDRRNHRGSLEPQTVDDWADIIRGCLTLGFCSSTTSIRSGCLSPYPWRSARSASSFPGADGAAALCSRRNNS